MMAAGDIKAGGAIVTIGVDLNPLTSGLKQVSKHLNSFGSKLTGLGAGVSAMSATVVAPLAAMAKVFADTGSTLDDISQRTGVSASSLSELGYAAKLSGSSLETVETALKTMGKSFAKIAQGKAPNVFKSLGLEAEKLQGIAPEEQFLLIGEALSKVTDPTLQAGLAMQVFGKAGTELLPMLKGGVAGIEEMRLEAQRLGVAMTDADAGAAAELGDALDRIGEAFRGGLLKAGAALAPIITDVSNGLANIVGYIANWVDNNRELVVLIGSIGLGIGAIGAAITIAGASAIFMGAAISGILAAVGAISAIGAALVSPFAIVAATVVGLGVGLAYVTGSLGRAWIVAKKFGGTLGEAWKAFSNAILAGDVAKAFSVVTTGLSLMWESAVSTISEYWSAAVKKIAEFGIQAWYGVANAMASAAYAAQDAWSFWSDSVTLGFADALDAAAEFFYLLDNDPFGTKRAELKKGYMDAGLTAEQADAHFRKMHEDKLTNPLAKEMRTDVKNAQTSREAARPKRELDAQAAIDANNSRMTELIAGLGGPIDRSKLEAAKKAFNDAVAKAAAATKPGGGGGRNLGGMMDGFMSSVGQKGEAVGTFSSAAVGRIGASSLDKEQLDVTRQMKGLLSSIDKTLNRIEDDD